MRTVETEHSRWPSSPPALETLQTELALLGPVPWRPVDRFSIGGCFVCFGRGGSGRGRQGDQGWAAAVVMRRGRIAAQSEVSGESGFAYSPGLLAAREGPLLDAAISALPTLPDVLLVNATGRDHPRRAGLALQLGWATGLPTVGVTHRTLVAVGLEPHAEAGSFEPLTIDGDQVGWLLRTRANALPVAVSPGWRIDLATARDVVLESVRWARTPEPIRQARRFARTARSRSLG